MKHITLELININNFKGITDLSVRFDNRDAVISGKNASGKTSIYDALLWCLFEKDSQGKSDFGVKPLNSDGAVINHLETSVEVVLRVDGTQRTFKRSLKEKWVQQTGEVEKVYKGNDTQWYVDGLKTKTKKAFVAEVEGIVDENTFRAITNVNHFINLPTKEQRAMLIALAPAVQIDESLVSQVARIIKSMPLEHVLKMKQQNVAESKKRSGLIPSLIEENFAQLQQGDEGAEDEVKRLDEEINELQTLINNVINGEALKNKERELADARLRQRELTLTASQERERELVPFREAVKKAVALQSQYVTKVQQQQAVISHVTQNTKLLNDNLADLKSRQSAMRAEWRAINTQTLPAYEGQDVCPTCEQGIAEGKQREFEEQFLAYHESEKKRRLDIVVADGKGVSARLLEVEGEIEELRRRGVKEEQQLSALEVELSKISLEVDDAKKMLSDAESKAQEPIDDSVVKALEKEVEVHLSDVKVQVSTLQQDLSALQSVRDATQAKLHYKENNARINVRIDELKEELTELGQAIIDEEVDIEVLIAYQDAMYKQVEIEVDKMFEITSFKFFEPQLNGEMKEVCYVQHGGVTVGRGLNTAATINVGIDIINTMSRRYNVTAPIFVDNSESVNNLIATKAQVIELRVNKEKLKITLGGTENE